jgi:hypothetical protein
VAFAVSGMVPDCNADALLEAPIKMLEGWIDGSALRMALLVLAGPPSAPLQSYSQKWATFLRRSPHMMGDANSVFFVTSQDAS